MSARRHSTRLAMAVSSILAAPAIATGFVLVAGMGFAPEVRLRGRSDCAGEDARGRTAALRALRPKSARRKPPRSWAASSSTPTATRLRVPP